MEEMQVTVRQLEEDLAAARRRADLYESELKDTRITADEYRRKAADSQQKLQKVGLNMCSNCVEGRTVKNRQ